MSSALCPQAVSQAPQHFRSSERQTTCDGCFARQLICSVISLHSSIPRAEQPTGVSEAGWRSVLITECAALFGSGPRRFSLTYILLTLASSSGVCFVFYLLVSTARPLARWSPLQQQQPLTSQPARSRLLSLVAAGVRGCCLGGAGVKAIRPRARALPVFMAANYRQMSVTVIMTIITGIMPTPVSR